MERQRLLRNSAVRDGSFTWSSLRNPRCENITLCLSNIFLMYFLILGLAILGSGVFARAHWAQYHIKDIEVTVLLLWIGLGVFVCTASLLGFLAMCCQHRQLLMFVVFLFSVLLCVELATAVFSMLFNHRSHRLLDHVWEISAPEFKLYIEDTWDCCGLFNYTDRVTSPCPLGGSVRACYPSLKRDLSYTLIITFCCSIAVALAQMVFIGTLSLLVYIMHGRTSHFEGTLMRTPR